MLPVLERQINGTLEDACVCDWLLSLTATCVRFIPIMAWSSSSFLCHGRGVFHRMDIPQSVRINHMKLLISTFLSPPPPKRRPFPKARPHIYPFLDGHFDGFLGECVHVPIAVEYIPRDRVAGSQGPCMLGVVSSSRFTKCFTNLHSH